LFLCNLRLRALPILPSGLAGNDWLRSKVVVALLSSCVKSSAARELQVGSNYVVLLLILIVTLLICRSTTLQIYYKGWTGSTTRTGVLTHVFHAVTLGLNNASAQALHTYWTCTSTRRSVLRVKAYAFRCRCLNIGPKVLIREDPALVIASTQTAI
jgi:hypothetical protein